MRPSGRARGASGGPAAWLLPLAASGLVACGAGGDAPPSSSLPAPDDGVPAASAVSVNEVVALATHGERVWVATSAGIVQFLPSTGAWHLSEGEAGISHERSTCLAVSSDGTAWTGHAAMPEVGEAGEGPDAAMEARPTDVAPLPPPSRHGGVRAFRPDGTIAAWFAADGLPSDHVVAVAAGDGFVIVATAGGMARLAADGKRFEPLPDEPRRRLTVVRPESAGASRAVTEFRPRDEHVTALAARGARLWIGTTHGLLARDGEALSRFVLPTCRRDGLAADVIVALGARPDGVVAAVGLATDEGIDPSGVVEITGDGSASRCHVPGVDVPAGLTSAVASDGRTTWLATYEGLVRLWSVPGAQASGVELLERGRELPERPPTAACVDASADGQVWVGFWGDGIARIDEDDVTTWRFGSGPSGVASPGTRLRTR